MTDTKTRVFSLDLLRVIACYLVIQVHAGEFFYIGEGNAVIAGNDAHWVGLLNSIGRSAVPLFIMLTGFFVLPVKDEMSSFFKKRFTRVAIPFVVWCIFYAFYKFFAGEIDIQTVFLNVLKIPVNFGTEVGHLWYVYMLIGLYLFIPIISPWIKQASQRGLLFYLTIWAITLLLPYIHQIFPEVLGECFWNNTPLLYYFSGFLGYAILGAYLKKYHSQKKQSDLLVGAILLIVGLVITTYIFQDRLYTQAYTPELELSWGYGTINVAMMALGLFFIFKNINCTNSAATKTITSISNMSYGMYLLHIMILNVFYSMFNETIAVIWIKIPVISICTFIVSYLIIKAVSYLPKSKYIIG